MQVINNLKQNKEYFNKKQQLKVGFECLPFGGVGASGLGRYHGIFYIK